MTAFLEDMATAWRIFRLLRTLFPGGADISITPRSADADSACPRTPQTAETVPVVGRVPNGLPKPAEARTDGPR